MAGVWKRGDGEFPLARMTKMIFVSEDQGRSWGPPVTLMPTETGVCEESDFCELPNGDLFWVHRVEHYAASPVNASRPGAGPDLHSDRMQSIVRKKGAAWEPGPAGPAPFPHSGFPCVLLTREGVILHLATDGTSWTSDLGKTWSRLSIPGTGYYPCAMQLSGGTIICIGHVGGDDVYGGVDQSIVLQTFRLKAESTSGPH
jgi:hypothetical protein